MVRLAGRAGFWQDRGRNLSHMLGVTMKKSKQCPKCDSLKVGYLENVMAWGPPFYKPGRPFSRGDLAAFVCGDCGYFETYLTNPKTDLEKLSDIDGFRWLNADQNRPYR